MGDGATPVEGEEAVSESAQDATNRLILIVRSWNQALADQLADAVGKERNGSYYAAEYLREQIKDLTEKSG